YYGGLFNVYKVAHQLRAKLGGTAAETQEAEDRFLAARQALLAEGGGVFSIIYHPCEFVHAAFWDGVNFRAGANPPREEWKLPPTKTAEESQAAFRTFEEYVRFMHRFPEVRFVTATQLARDYADRARGREFAPAELLAIAAAVKGEVTYQRR